ncbi:MAG: hypothetical protein CXR30_09925 [Geobacter sp.]|nr:MAG: hypothetical protein CXR30_09925 [Geobacter sp.]
MDDISTFLAQIKRSFFEEREKVERLRDLETQLDKDPLYGEYIESQAERLRGELIACRNDMDHLVKLLLRVPPWHSRHRTALSSFFKNGDFEKSVFIMTKFPESDSENDKKLKNIIEVVCNGLTDRGLIPRLATGARYHDWLWDEVEIHLLGCSTGIAIVEDRYRPELNPNVAMEWGWMRAMGKRVLFLREDEFAHGRADLGGLRSWNFNWETPKTGVLAALSDWFGPI